MATAQVTLGITTDGLPGGGGSFAPAVYDLSNPIGEILQLPLASGDNAITVPPGASVIGITPPPGNRVALKLKGAVGDVGTVLNAANPGLLAIDYPAGGTLYLNAASAISSDTEVAFW